MRNLLKRLRGMGKTIIVSSHILPELADICNKIGIIDRGVMNVSADVDDVMRQVRRYIVLHIKVVKDEQAAMRVLRTDATVREVEAQDGHLVVTLREGEEKYDHLAARLVEDGFGIHMFREEELSLEAAFMALTKGMGAGASSNGEPAASASKNVENDAVKRAADG